MGLTVTEHDERPASRPEYDGLRFGPEVLLPGSVIGHYHQQDDLITAEFSGESVLTGRLVGLADAAGVINASYCQVMRDGEIVAGRCVSTPTVLADGRVRLSEQWHRIDGTSGISQITEIAELVDLTGEPAIEGAPVLTSAESPAGSPEAGPDERPHLLLISTGDRLFREYLLAPIAEQYRIHLFLAAQPLWETQYVDAVTVLADTLNAEEMIAAAAELNARDRIDGVLCWDEARVLSASKVAQSLGLPGGDPEMVLRCRDKHLTRELAAAAGIAQPRSVLVGSVDEAATVAADIGYPVVLKPRGVAASLGVVLAGDEAELRELFDFAHDTTAPGAILGDSIVLVEEYADGPEISVDCAVFGGEVLPICLAHKEIGYPPYFEEVGHLVDGADPMLTDPAFRQILEAAHQALGFSDGMTHAEFRLTPSGPKLIEVNARLGGDLIPYLGLRATGIDPGLAAAAVACGRRPDVAPDRKRFGAVRFCYVPYEMTIGAIAFESSRMPAGVDLAVVRAAPGQHHSPPPAGTVWGRIAYVTAVADTEVDARTTVAAAEAALVVAEAAEGEPVQSGVPRP